MNAVTPTKPNKAIVDPKLVFLHRAHSRLLLFENGLITHDEAVFGLLKDYCPCICERRSN